MHLPPIPFPSFNGIQPLGRALAKSAFFSALLQVEVSVLGSESKQLESLAANMAVSALRGAQVTSSMEELDSIFPVFRRAQTKGGRRRERLSKHYEVNDACSLCETRSTNCSPAKREKV